jgi:hypothetical protein
MDGAERTAAEIKFPRFVNRKEDQIIIRMIAIGKVGQQRDISGGMFVILTAKQQRRRERAVNSCIEAWLRAAARG